MDNLFSILFILPESKLNNKEKDKIYQEFTLFVNQSKVKKEIQEVRKFYKIKPTEINKRINKYKALCKKRGNIARKLKIYIKKHKIPFEDAYMTIGRKMGMEKIKQKMRSYWSDLNKYIGSKIKIANIEDILRGFKKPIDWDIYLSCYVLTNKILYPLPRKHIHLINGKKYLEISPTITARQYREQYKKIAKEQLDLPGYDIKKKRKKPKLEEHLSIAKGCARYKKEIPKPRVEYDYTTGKDELISERLVKERKRYELVERFNSKAVNSIKKQKREDSRLRQVYKRYKEYI